MIKKLRDKINLFYIEKYMRKYKLFQGIKISCVCMRSANDQFYINNGLILHN